MFHKFLKLLDNPGYRFVASAITVALVFLFTHGCNRSQPLF